MHLAAFPSRWVSILVFAAVLVSIFTFVASTVPHGEMQNLCKLASDAGYDETCRPAPKEMFGTADFVCVMFFTVEYGLRLLLSTVVRAELCDRERTRLLEWVTSDEVVHFPSAVQRLLEFVAAPSNLVDLFAIMPWYIEQVSDQGRENAIIQLIRLTRVIRAFRLGRRLEAAMGTLWNMHCRSDLVCTCPGMRSDVDSDEGGHQEDFQTRIRQRSPRTLFLAVVFTTAPVAENKDDLGGT